MRLFSSLFEMNMLALNNQTFLTVHVKQDFLFFQQTVIDKKKWNL